LNYINKKFTGYDWIIEVDLERYFDTVNHSLLLEMLGEQMKCRKTLTLIKSALKARVIKDGLVKASPDRTPQGSVLRPTLRNIYLHKFDLFIEELIDKYRKDVSRKTNPEYQAVEKS